MGFFQGVATPVGIAAVGAVPVLGQGPALFHAEGGAVGLVPLPAPVVNMLLRPEEQHRLSGVDEVVPPVAGRDGEVDDAFGGGQFAAFYAELHALAAVAAGGGDNGVLVEHGGDAECVPDAVAPVGYAARFDLERSGHGGKGAAHEDFAAGALEEQHVGVGQPLEGLADGVM